MWDAWCWRYSRQAELFAMVACVIGNRIPMNEEAVVLMDLLRGFPLYRENK